MEKTNIFILLDSSGSMKEVKLETIEHFNSQLDMIKSSSSKMKNNVSLFTFNESVNEVFFNISSDDVSPLNDSSYKPEGLTSVNDAISHVLDKASEIDDGSPTLFIILSDGKDNSSSSTSREISRKVSKLQETGLWTFTYIGANQDLSKVCRHLSIPKGNVLKYDSHSLGINAMTESHKKSLGYFFTARSYGTKATRGFYGSDK